MGVWIAMASPAMHGIYELWARQVIDVVDVGLGEALFGQAL